MAMLECPSISETIFGCTPLVRSSVAQVCLRSWKRTSRTPARLRSGLHDSWGGVGRGVRGGSGGAVLAEVVEAHVAHPGPPKERFPRFVVEVGPVDGGADPGREHQTLIVPVVPCGGALGLLAPPVPPQRLDGSCGEPYLAAAAPGLGLGEAGGGPRPRRAPPLAPAGGA